VTLIRRDVSLRSDDVTTAADLLVDMMMECGIRVVFGLPGNGINGIMEALRDRQERIRFIQVRHEKSTAFMATAYAKWTGKIACCLATSGPGAVHSLNGLYDAKFDCVPVLAITGLPYHDLVDTATQQDVATDRLSADVAAYTTRIGGVAADSQRDDVGVPHSLRSTRRRTRCDPGRCPGARGRGSQAITPERRITC
jgi:thiamine pyrophosphate-dependent acetolactate synthase large subunit-like protein